MIEEAILSLPDDDRQYMARAVLSGWSFRCVDARRWFADCPGFFPYSGGTLMTLLHRMQHPIHGNPFHAMGHAIGSPDGAGALPPR